MLEIGKQTGSISWVTKSKPYMRANDDVQIGVSNVKGRPTGSIIIRNNLYKKFDSEYLMFGIDGTRLYMKASDSKSGYKMCDTTSAWNRYVKVHDSTFADWCSNHRGNYSLSYDTELGLNYIETSKEV